MPSRKKTAPKTKTDTLAFETALAQLEEVVDAMEAEELPLEELVTYYEKGSSLLKHCEKSLNSAKKRIELITLANKEELPSDDSSQETGSEETDEQNDISLF